MNGDHFQISFDGLCIYVCLAVENPLPGKIALVMADLFILGVFFVAACWWIPLLALVSLTFLILLMRFTLWSFFGRENLIISKMAVCYQYDYGLIRMPQVTRKLSKALRLAYDSHWLDKDVIKVKLNLVSYDENDLPVLVHQVALPVTVQQAGQFDDLLKQLFMDNRPDDHAMPVINLN
jgi:hypothetical protein